jgi:acyl-CoA dehydrogenase
MIKVVAPNIAADIIDMAIQAHGGGGVSDDFPLAYSYANQRTLRLADGPDEEHRQSIAKLELAKHMAVKSDVEMPVTRGC